MFVYGKYVSVMFLEKSDGEKIIKVGKNKARWQVTAVFTFNCIVHKRSR